MVVVLDAWKQHVVLNSPFIGIWLRRMEGARGSTVGGKRIERIIFVVSRPDGGAQGRVRGCRAGKIG
jgi:hypothetical protein